MSCALPASTYGPSSGCLPTRALTILYRASALSFDNEAMTARHQAETVVVIPLKTPNPNLVTFGSVEKAILGILPPKYAYKLPA
ncbi:hypothetical protein M378DRAFT_160096 [Amanita muscaria Koide BX008]|uniref:Uncharacterized protein n=1 Tax=Amanita muscaria (strain Koide BX008) TaxID=946122 RepID=A0A0C2XE68_AMAMK|nr:hypothetical protein M378DRAFT_160096 [Amanita muscaria Koide BX008]